MKVRNAVSSKRARALKAVASTLFGPALAMGLVVAQVQPADAFTLFSSLLDNYQPGQATDPKANVDGQNASVADFSDCVNQAADHWSWPLDNNGNVTITYAYDPSFDQLFVGLDPSVEASVKDQIRKAMDQWELAPVGSPMNYGFYDSYARSSGLTTTAVQSQTIPPFMDVRSATVHELGHVLGFAHCDQGVSEGRNYAYFDGGGNRGTGGQNIGSYSGDFDPFKNYYNSLTGFNNFGNPLSVGYWGQEVMSQYSSSGFGFGRQPGEIYHTLSWDELDGYRFIYGAAPLLFTTTGSPTLIIKAAPLSDPNVVCEGVPFGLPNSANTPYQGVTIQSATIIFNTAFNPGFFNPFLAGEQAGYSFEGYNFDLTAGNGTVPITSVKVSLSGTENTTLVAPDPTYNGLFTTYSTAGTSGFDEKDSISVTWTGLSTPIPPNQVFHVGLTADVYDWIDYPLTVNVTDTANNINQASATPVDFLMAAGVNGYVNNTSANNPFQATCLTTTVASNLVGAAGLAVTAPANNTKVYNLQVADVTGMGLSLSNLNRTLLTQLQQSNRMITVTNFGTNVLNRGQKFVVILQGDASHLPSNISNYVYLNRPDLLGKQLFAYVASTNNHMRVDNYTLLNTTPRVAAGGRPTLNIQPGPTNTVNLSWPAAFTGYSLQQNTSLDDGGDGWFICSNGLPHPPKNGTNSVTVPMTSPTMFYRLSNP
jgi:hypothetical protein